MPGFEGNQVRVEWLWDTVPNADLESPLIGRYVGSTPQDVTVTVGGVPEVVAFPPVPDNGGLGLVNVDIGATQVVYTFPVDFATYGAVDLPFTTQAFNGILISDFAEALRPITAVFISSQSNFVDNGSGTQAGIDVEDIIWGENYIYLHVGGERRFDGAQVVLDVQFANAAPDIGDPATTVNLAENTLLVADIDATDADIGLYSETLTFSLAGGADEALFAIDSTSGVLSFIGAPDYEVPGDAGADNSYVVVVRVTDSMGGLDEQIITINITDSNEFAVSVPVDTDGAAGGSVAEGAVNGTLVGITASAQDLDATNNTVSYSLTDNAGGRFAIHTATGVVTVANGALIDHETAAQHQITVRATSSDGSFADQTFSIAVTDIQNAHNDFNGDGTSDIVFQHTNGQLYQWQLNGTAVTGAGTVGINSDSGWRVAGTGYFNHDDYADLVFQHATTGQVYQWQLNGTTVVGSSPVGFNSDPAWQLVETGDFNADGRSDLIFQHANGQVYQWLLDGATVVGAAQVGINSDAGWRIVGTGDLSSVTNEHSDLFFQHTNGQVYTWRLSGATVTSAFQIGNNSDADLRVVDVGDFDRDGHSDLLFQHTNGQLFQWRLVDGAVVAAAQVGFNSDAGWRVVEAGDFNRDGTWDILFQHDTTAQLYQWQLNGFAVIGSGSVGSNSDVGWQVVT